MHSPLNIFAPQGRFAGRRRVSALLLGLALAAGAQPVMAGNDMSGHDMADHAMAGMDPHAHHHMDMGNDAGKVAGAVKRSEREVKLAPIAMVRQDGSATNLSQVLGGTQPVILAFIYTSCTTVCPVTSQILSGAQDALGTERTKVRIVSISIDPEYDTPARLSAYGQRFGAGANWQHYGGTLADSVAIQKLFGAYRGDKMNHASVIFINGGAKKKWLQLEGFPSAEQLILELHAQQHTGS